MTVNVSKPAINVREKLAELDKPTGIAGEAMLRAETPQEQFNLIGAGRRNLLINGDMQIAQRGTSATITATGSSYDALDRFESYRNSSYAPNFTISRDTTGPAGFSRSLKIDVDATATPSSGQNFGIRTKI